MGWSSIESTRKRRPNGRGAKRIEEVVAIGGSGEVTLKIVCDGCSNIFSYTTNPRNYHYRNFCDVCRKLRKKGEDLTNFHKRRTSLNLYLRRNFNIGIEEYDSLFDKQNGKCAICLEKPISKRLCVDHDRKCCNGINSCGKCVRGLLCNSCNTALGFFKDSEKSCFMAKKYLKIWRNAKS